MPGPYALEEWYDTPDARRIQADSFAATNNYADPTFFPNASAGIRGGRQAAGYLSTPQPRNMAALRDQQQQTSLRQRALEELKRSRDAAFAEEQARQQQILAGYKERRQRAMDSLGGALTTALMPINDRFDKIAASTRSTFNQTGLGGTTALPTTLLGIERERNRNVGQLVNSMGPSIAGMEAQLSGDELDFLRSVETEYPDEKSMYDLALLEGSGDPEGTSTGVRGALPTGGVSPGLPGAVLVPGAPLPPPSGRRNGTGSGSGGDKSKAAMQAYYDQGFFDDMVGAANRKRANEKIRNRKAAEAALRQTQAAAPTLGGALGAAAATVGSTVAPGLAPLLGLLPMAGKAAGRAIRSRLR